jgi:23S rRNA (pseudouridine1915-N3)-methyltransferase
MKSLFLQTNKTNLKISLWSIGKQHEPYIITGVEDFTSRISRYFPAEWLLISTPKLASKMSVQELKKAEAVTILSMLQKEDFLVVLDEKGKMLTSPDLSAFIQNRANESTKNIVFLIGGAYGVDETILKKAQFRWSLSTLVFPHQLVRLILSEQIYRACTILRNEKYHHQ